MIAWFIGMRHKERYGTIPVLEPVLRRWRPQSQNSVDESVPSTPLELSDEDKSLGAGANYRSNEVV